MSSREVLDVISIATEFHQRPSDILAIEDAYTKYCFDEACTYIINKMRPTYDKDGKEIKGLEPRFPDDKFDNNKNEGLQFLMKQSGKA